MIGRALPVPHAIPSYTAQSLMFPVVSSSFWTQLLQELWLVTISRETCKRQICLRNYSHGSSVSPEPEMILINSSPFPTRVLGSFPEAGTSADLGDSTDGRFRYHP